MNTMVLSTRGVESGEQPLKRQEEVSSIYQNDSFYIIFKLQVLEGKELFIVWKGSTG